MTIISCLGNLVKSKATDSKLSVPDGLLYALIGFVLVIGVLVLLMGCIYGLSALIKCIETKSKGGAKKATPATPVEEKVAPGVSGSIKLNNVDERTAAMCMAIVADELQTPINELRFLSIKEISEEGK